ncbi:MAG TPA: S-layer homology domain-containing protein [Candidatus Limnocylindria bacterium]|nr:S-layer homology domain-containing protein [Candidatus Limnocylindria bacterium]
MSARRLLPILALALSLAAFPIGTLGSHQFADVPDSNVFHADIDAIADAGVTSGCGGGNYCPSAYVTRAQMAAFMNRLGALAAGKTPVVNADKLDGFTSTDLLGDHPEVRWNFTRAAAPNRDYVNGTTVFPAGSTLAMVSGTISVTDVPVGCAAVQVFVNPGSVGNLGLWFLKDTTTDLTNWSSAVTAPNVLSSAAVLTLKVHCYDAYPLPANLLDVTPTVTGTIVIAWTQGPVVIPFP